MRLLRDWKWYAALAVFALFTAFVVWLPDPVAKPEVTSSATAPEDATSDMPPPVRPDPTPAEYNDMPRYTVQEDDTAAGIARLFAISEEDLRWANHIPDRSDLAVGEKIWIPNP